MDIAVIATTTFYPDPADIRIDLACEFIRQACLGGYPLVIVDGGSPLHVVDRFMAASVTPNRPMFGVLQQKIPGMGPGRRQALKAAGEVAGKDGVVIWTEPEKHTIVEWLTDILQPFVEGIADTVNPHRVSLTTYPPEQQHFEEGANLAVEYMLGRPLDIWLGTYAMNAQALAYVLNYEGDYGDTGYDSIHVPRYRMLAAGLQSVSVPIAYRYPEEQTTEETGQLRYLVKRIDQLQLVKALWKEAYKLGLTTQKPPDNL